MAISVKALEQAIRDKRGNLAAVARSFSVSRNAIAYRVNKSEKLKKVVSESRDIQLDNAETELYDQMLSGNTAALIFFLKTQGKGRGYIERQELAQTGEQTINLIWGDGGDD